MDTDRHYTNTQITRQRNGSKIQSKNRWKKKGKFDITNTHIHDHSFSWLGTSTSHGHCVVCPSSIYGFWLPFKLFWQLKVWKIRPKRQVVHILPWQHISTSEVIIILHLSINVIY